MQEGITGSVRALSAWKKETQADLGRVLGLSPVSVAHRLGGRLEWNLRDVQALCDHYRITMQQLTEGPSSWLNTAGGATGDNVRYPALDASELDGPAEFPPIESTLVAA